MSKKQRILDLYDGTRTTREIAESVGCLPEYVRVVARQRFGRGESDADLRYRRSPLGKAMRRRTVKARYHSNPKFRAHLLAYQRVYKRQKRQREAEARP